MAEEDRRSPTIDNDALLEGIRRALPGLDSFLRDRLANEPLSADVGAQLAHLIHQLDKLEGDVVNKEALQEASACRASTSVSSADMEDEISHVAYQGFLVQGTQQMNNLFQWNRRWCVLPADGHVLAAYAMRSRTVQTPLWEIDLLGCRVAPVDPKDSGDKTSAFKIIPPEDSGLPTYLLRTYEESEMRKCLRVFAAVTGVQHTESELTNFLPSAGAPSGLRVSTSPMPPRSASSASRRTSDNEDGEALYDVPPPSRRVAAEDTYDVPPSRGAMSRAVSDFDFPSDEQLRETPPTPGDMPNSAGQEVDPNYSELTFREMPKSKTELSRDERTSNAPDVPERTSQMLIASLSDASNERPTATMRDEQLKEAKASYASEHGDGLYESLGHDNGELDDVHLSDSNTDDREGIYEPLDIDDASDGYTSSGSVNSLVSWFKRGSGDRKSGAKKKKGKEAKDRRHRLSRSVSDLVDPDQDGFLAKRSGAGLTWRRRWCVLKDMCLYYFRSKDDNVARNAIILPGWRLVQVSDDVKRPFTFKLSHDGMNDCFFSADSSDSYETWMASLEHCLHVPNGNQAIPHGLPALKPKTRADLEAESLFQAVDNLAHRQWEENDINGDYNVPPSRDGPGSAVVPADDALYVAPRPNAGSLSTSGSMSAEQYTADVRKGSGGANSLGVPPPIPSGPRPSPGQGRKPPPRLPPGDDTYEPVVSPLRRQESEYDTDQYLNPSECRTTPSSPLPDSPLPPETMPEPLPERNKSLDGTDSGAQSFQRGGLYGSLSRLMRRSAKGKGDAIAKSVSIKLPDGGIEGLVNRRGALKMWSPHFCRLKSGVFYCYKADDKSGYGEGAAELELRMLSQKVGNADREVKKANSIFIVKAPRGSQSPNMSRAFFLQCDNDQDYQLWITHLQRATEISVRTVSDATSIHTAGRQAPATMDLREAQRMHSPGLSPPLSPSVFDSADSTFVDNAPGNDTYDVPQPSASAKIPSWLQEDLKAGSAQEAATLPDVKGIPIVGNPLWWAIVSTPTEATIEGALSIKQGTMSATRSWQKHWCQVSNGRLRCFREKSDKECVIELRLGDQLLTHAPERGRPYCFSIFVSDKRALCLSAEIKMEMDDWMGVLIATRSAALTVDQRLVYNAAPQFTVLAPRPVVRRGGTSDVEGEGYYHDVPPGQRLHVDSPDNYYPSASIAEHIVKAPLEKASRGASATLPPSYRQGGNITAAPAASGGKVQEGYLQKRSGPSLWHRRYCFLQGTRLRVYSQKGSQKAIQDQSLADCGLDVSSKDGRKDSFKITPPSPHPRIYFQASSAKERTQWLEALAMAIQQAREGSGLPPPIARKRFSSFRRPRSTVIDISTLRGLEEPPKRRGLIGRIRSWSQENVSRPARHQDLVVEPTGYSSRSDYGYNPNDPAFKRGAVSLGHGEFKRDRGTGGKSRSTPSRSMSGVLFLNYGDGEATLWCEVSNGRLSAFEKPGDATAAFSGELAGARIRISTSIAPQDRVITVEGGNLKQPLYIRVSGPAKTFDEWLNVVQSATVEEKPLKRSWSMRLRRSMSLKRNRDRQAKRDNSKARSAASVDTTGSALDLATTRGGGAAPKDRPLPRPPGMLPPVPGVQQDSGGDSLLPDFASKLTDDLNALTSAADADEVPKGSKKDTRTMSLPNENQSKKAEPNARVTGSMKPRGLPAYPPEPATADKPRKPKVPTPPQPSVSKPPAGSSDPTTRKARPPAPQRTDSMNGELPVPVIRSVSSSPRPRTNSDVQMSAPPPPPSSLRSPKAYSDLLKEYEDKVKSVNMQASEKRTELTKDRIDLVRQQVDMEARIKDCGTRLTALDSKKKTRTSGSKGREDPYEIKRERLDLQNKRGWTEGKIQRIDDQILRVATDLGTAICRLEKERNQRIELLSGNDVESAM